MSSSRKAWSGRLMSEIRARMVASESPLTRCQVVNLAHQAMEEDGRPEFEMWLFWSGSIEEVGEWLWQFWVENAVDPDEGERGLLDLPRPETARVGNLTARTSGSPATARDVGQRRQRVSSTIG
jgi:hypothetical protein